MITELKKELKQWYKGIAEDRNILANRIFAAASKGEITRLEAIRLIHQYDLLKIADWIRLPEFVGNNYDFDRNQTVYYYDLLAEHHFEEPYRTFYTSRTKAINQVYRMMKYQRVMGCIYDW